jgi:hypothetical protein
LFKKKNRWSKRWIEFGTMMLVRRVLCITGKLKKLECGGLFFLHFFLACPVLPHTQIQRFRGLRTRVGCRDREAGPSNLAVVLIQGFWSQALGACKCNLAPVTTILCKRQLDISPSFTLEPF